MGTTGTSRASPGVPRAWWVSSTSLGVPGVLPEVCAAVAMLRPIPVTCCVPPRCPCHVRVVSPPHVSTSVSPFVSVPRPPPTLALCRVPATSPSVSLPHPCHVPHLPCPPTLALPCPPPRPCCVPPCVPTCPCVPTVSMTCPSPHPCHVPPLCPCYVPRHVPAVSLSLSLPIPPLCPCHVPPCPLCVPPRVPSVFHVPPLCPCRVLPVSLPCPSLSLPFPPLRPCHVPPMSPPCAPPRPLRVPRRRCVPAISHPVSPSPRPHAPRRPRVPVRGPTFQAMLLHQPVACTQCTVPALIHTRSPGRWTKRYTGMLERYRSSRMGHHEPVR